jgi:hypothetical protein
MENIAPLVSIWVVELSLYSLPSGSSREGVYRKKEHPTKADRISGDMPATTIAWKPVAVLTLWHASWRVGAFPKLISPQFVRPFVKSNK